MEPSNSKNNCLPPEIEEGNVEYKVVWLSAFFCLQLSF